MASPLAECAGSARVAYGKQTRRSSTVNSRAVAENVIRSDTRRVLIRLARSRYFPDRTYHATMRLADDVVPGAELNRLRRWLRHRCPDLKAEDAVRLLRVANRLSKSA